MAGWMGTSGGLMLDLIIRGGTLIDGTGAPRRTADVGVSDGKVVAVGKIDEQTEQSVDADGALVTPGFVDIHTHYDGQATWDARMQPSSLHGVTTVVMGNCGVGFAPCRPDDHSRLIKLMEGVEDIPFPVLDEGLPWNWESFPDYLDALAARRFDVDIGSQLPHAALRVFVMGERGAEREPATEADIAAMRSLAKQAAQSGALGFSTSRTLNHRTSEGKQTPTLKAAEGELAGIAMGLADACCGVLQVVSDFADARAEFAMLRRIVEASGRPLSFSLVQSPLDRDGWKNLLSELENATAAGLPMKAQVCGRPVGLLFGFELTLNPFSMHPTYREIAKLPLAERVARLRDPEVRARLLSEEPADAAWRRRLSAWERYVPLAPSPNYEPGPEDSIAAEAARRGVSVEEAALDHMLSHEG